MRSVGAKEKVEEAALELFAAHGVDGVAIGDIAAKAGVSQGALYRHYPSKDDLAWNLFSAAYLRTGAELDALRTRETGFASRVAAMVAHFCTLYDSEPARFRFMLLAQHGFLPRVPLDQRTPVDAINDTVADAVATGEIGPVECSVATAAIMGVVMQTAVFHIYGRFAGSLADRAAALGRAAIAAVTALAG